nr:hypothetical protein [Tanacetum cinerariifolium]
MVSRHQNTQQYGAILPIELTTEDIRNTKAYKEYYACATREVAPKPKASARRKKGGYDSSTTPLTLIATPTPITTVVAALRLTAAGKGKQPARATSPADPLDVERTEAEQLKIVLRRSRQETHISQHGGFSIDEGTGSKPGSEEEETKEEEEESFDIIPRTPEDGEDDGNGEDDQGIRISEEERIHEEEEADELYRMESIFTVASSTVAPLPSPTSTMTPSIIITTTTASQPPIPPTPTLSEVLQNLPTFELVFCFEDRVKSLEVNFSKFMRTNQFAKAVSNIPPYKAYKTILDSYGEPAILKRRREDDDDQEGPSAGSDQGSITGTQSRQMSASESAFAEEPVQTTCQMDEPSHPVFKTAVQGSALSWISELTKQADARSSFNDLLDTLLDFSNFIMNWLGVDTLTLELLAGPTYELMRGSCNSLTELEYHLEEVYKVTTDQLDWVNPEGKQYPHNLLQPLPLIPDNQGRRVILFAHFINNDLEYLRGGEGGNLGRRHVVASYWTAASDVPHTSASVSAGQRRSMPPATGQRQRFTVVIGGQRRSPVANHR